MAKLAFIKKGGDFSGKVLQDSLMAGSPLGSSLNAPVMVELTNGGTNYCNI
jgi:hypothetical protein